MERLDLAWAAGFFDAEGCFSGAGGTPHATASQVDLEPLDVFANTVQVGTIRGPYEKATPSINRRPQWIYYAYGANAEALFGMLAPWLGGYRNTQARNAIGAGRPIEGPEPFHTFPLTERVAWCGGFFEGEGCFSLSGRAITSRVANTDPELIARFSGTVATGHVYGPYDRGPGRKQQQVFAAAGFERVQATLAMLWPWLSSRRRIRAMQLLADHLTYFYGCGHRRDPRQWRKHCPLCFKPGPKPGSKNRPKSPT